jgi:hypothetical protein
MVMPVMTKMYHQTGNKLFLDKLYEYYMYSQSIMFDEETKLFFRDSRFIYPNHKTINGKKDFWSRGNGWLFAGLARILPDLPDNWEHKGLFIRQFQQMASTLKTYQQTDGSWSRSIIDQAFAPGPETSGTAFFTYGLLWGINNGYLRESEYSAAALSGWKFLSETALQADGKIGFVQPIGEKAIPGQVVDASSTANFGVGAFLLASSEMYRYAKKLEQCKLTKPDKIEKKFKSYLFVYFTGNRKSEEQVRFAISKDGLNFKCLNNNQPVLNSDKISLSGGVRDPHILRGVDGKNFYMVITDMVSAKGWSSNRGIVMLKSTDLINWTSSTIHFPTAFPEVFATADRVWAPQTIYDAEAGKYMVYFALRKGEQDYDKIYYAYANKDFTGFENTPVQLFYHPEKKSCIDADIIYQKGKYHLFFKTEGNGNGIKKAVSIHLTHGWILQDTYLQQTKNAVEGSGIFKLNHSDDYILMYDVYMNGRYEFTKSSDLENFSLINPEEISMNFHPRHGTVLPITDDELKRLEKKWSPDYPKVSKNSGNPVLKGFFADPDILYSNLTNQYYIYPTSDGFDGWSGTYFKTFSSVNLKKWKDEGTILTLGKDVKWADRNAWAPCIIEKKIDGKYKYFYYFTAAQKIGVAVADHPAGPFIDSGKALIAERPAGIKNGQVIDPEVFHDPVSDKYYLYWGNGFLAGAELNDDMTSIKEETLKVITPRNGQFREGTHVFFRNGKYYFSWSIDDTRSPDYRVGYGISDAPLGSIILPENFIILKKNEALGIFGTGHHSTIQVPGTDQWYMVYHRFCYPDGIQMGEKAGFNRETCIDKMEFNPDGTIIPVIPTHKGLK